MFFESFIYISRLFSFQNDEGAPAEMEQRARQTQLRGQDAPVPGGECHRRVLRRVLSHG